MALRIDGFRPAEGWPGTILVVEGDGFSLRRDDNEVFIGGDRALIIEASANELRVLAGEKTVSGPVEVAIGATRATSPKPFRVLPAPDVTDLSAAGPPAFFHGPQHGTPAVQVADQPILVVFAAPTDTPPGAGGTTARTNFINDVVAADMQYWRDATYGQTTWKPAFTDWVSLPYDHGFYFWDQSDVDDARRSYLDGTRRCATAGLGSFFVGHQGQALNVANRTGLPIIFTAGAPITGAITDASFLYVIAGNNGLTVFEPPAPDNSITQVGADRPGAWFHDIDISGQALAISALDQGTWLYQVTSGTPTLISKIPIVTPGQWSTAVRFAGSRLFIGEGQTLRAFDVSDLRAPKETGTLDVSDWIMELDVAANLCALATDGQGLVLVDVSTPMPVFRSSHKVTTRLHSVKISGKTVFAAGGDAGLLLFDVTDPNAPTPVSQLAMRAAAYHVHLGTSAYVSIGAVGLAEVDVSNPAAPSITQEWDLPVAVSVSNPDLAGLRNALKVALDQSGQAQRRDALFHDALVAAEAVGFDPNAFQGFAVIVNGGYVRANSSLRDRFQHEETGDTYNLAETKGTFYTYIGEGQGTLAHEIGHWLHLPDLYSEMYSDGSMVIGSAGPWSLMGGNTEALFCAKELHETLHVYRTTAPNVNVVELDWSPTDPPLDRKFDIVAHDLSEDTDPNRIHILKINVSSGLTYYVETREKVMGRPLDQSIPLDHAVVVTRATQAQSISNTFERPISLVGALDVGDQAVDAARRLIISVDSIQQLTPRIYRVRVQWNQDIAGDPNGKFDMTITPWNTDNWETVDIWVDSPRNNTGGKTIYENHEPGDDTKPILNGDRPWVKRANTIFARVRNTGPAVVPEVYVTFYSTSPPGVGDNGNWAALETQHITSFPGFDPKVPGSGEQVLACSWTPAVDAHTCLKVAILPQLGEIEPNNNMAQENVFTFDSPGSSSHDPVTLAARVRSPFTVWRKVDTVVRGLPKGWHVVVDHSWVWVGPKGEHDLTAIIWTDLDAPYTFGPPLTPQEKLSISRHADARLEGWTDFHDRNLPIGGILARVKANKRVTGTLIAGMEGKELRGNGQLTPPMVNIPMCIEVTDASGNRSYLYAVTDGSGKFDLQNGGKPLMLGAGHYLVQAFISGNDDAAEAALPPVDVIVK